MRMDKFTSKFQSALADAQSLAVGRDHQYIEPLHLMLAMLQQQGNSVSAILNQIGAAPSTLAQSVESEIKKLPQVSGNAGEVHLSPELGKVLNICDKISQQRQDQYIASELFLLAVLETKSTLAKLLNEQGITKHMVEDAINKIRGGQGVDDPNAEENRQALEKYTID